MTGVGSSSGSRDKASSFHRHGYDVFLSGTDWFTNRVFGALDLVGVKTFMDSEELDQGKELLGTQIEAMWSSRIAIVVFSPGYAISRRCLYEVTEIFELMKGDLMVLPIFHEVDPNDVGNQTGPYAKAFDLYESICKDEVERWRLALKEASSFSGYMVTPDKAESLILPCIARHVLLALNYTWSQSSANLVGMESHLAAFDSLLKPETKDVQMVAICGMEGIGKTTIAKALYQIKRNSFRYCAILENVRETCPESSQNDLLKLQRRLLSQISIEEEKICDVDEGVEMIKQNCRDKKMLLVIDDVNDRVQLEKLAGACDWFGPSSKIVVTTRYKSILYNRKELKLYEVPPLKADDAYELFTRTAFQDNDNTEAYGGVVDAALQFAQGFPLAITVLGGLFRSKPKNEWESTLQVLKSCPSRDIFDSCSNLVQLPLLPHRFHNSVRHRRSKLVKLPLLPPSRRELVVTKCRNLVDFPRLPPSLRSFVVNGCHEIVKLPPLPPILQSLKVRECDELVELPPLPHSLQSLEVRWCSKLVELPPLPHSLQSLKVSGYVMLVKLPPLPHSLQSLEVDECHKLVELPSLPPSLQSLKVSGYLELVKLPPLPHSLQSLEVRCHKLVELPSLPPSLQSLKVRGYLELVKLPPLPHSLQSLEVDWFHKLVELPSLPPSLQSLEVYWCDELVELPPLPHSLQSLEVDRCHKLVELPSLPHSLQSLKVDRCHKLVELPSLPPSLQSLKVHQCLELVKLPPLPPSLRSLEVYWCHKLVKLPPLPHSLRILKVSEYLKQVELPPLPHSLQSLKRSLPPSPDQSLDKASLSTPKLVGSLFWSTCWRISKYPESLVRMEILNELSLHKTAIDELPPSIENFVGLKKLYIQECKNIKTLPNSICRLQSLQRVSLYGCFNLVEFPEYADRSSGSSSTQKPLLFPKGTYIDLRGCRLREINFIKYLDCTSTLKSLDLSGNKLVTIPECISKLSALQQLNLENCKQLREILGLPPNLKYLFAKGCKSLEWYAPLSSMLKRHSIDSPWFRQIDFSGCNKLSQGDSALGNFFSIEDLIVDSQTKILHPGREIPKWFRYKSMGGSINFSVDKESYQSIDGLAFCMVIGSKGWEQSEVSFSCQIEVNINNRKTYGYVDSFKSMGSDHMWLMHVPSRMTCGWHKNMQSQCNEFNFRVLFELPRGTLKCCGVHLVPRTKDEQDQSRLHSSS